MIASPVTIPDDVSIRPGPALLDSDDDASLAAHRRRTGPLPSIDRATLSSVTERMRLRGRGGAGFPFAAKLASLGRGRAVVVVNLSEGEPASVKDSVLAIARPHLILDGASLAAAAIGARDIHVVLPGERAAVVDSLTRAVSERTDTVRFQTRVAAPRFIAGERSAVLELLAGRPGLPVTSWQPESVSGHQGRPTLLSNAETWAQLAQLLIFGEHAYARYGTPREPGTTLLTVWGGVTPEVMEVGYGTPLREILPPTAAAMPILMGGFHGTWVSGEAIASARVSVDALRALGTPLGAGVVLPVRECPVRFTAKVLAYLADQSAGRCGPCFNGLPALAAAFASAERGEAGLGRVHQLAALVDRRGACGHPDGTVRLVRSLIDGFGPELERHADGACIDRGAL